MVTKKTAGKVTTSGGVSASEAHLMDYLARKGISAGDAKPVTSSSWKWEDGVPKYFKVLGLPVKQPKRAGSSMEPPFTVPVKDLDTGDHCTLLVNTMLLNQFASFPGDELIGKCFVSVRSEVEGKAYKGFDTVSVPDPSPESE